MNVKKRAIPLLIVTLMMLAMVPLVPVHATIDVLTVSADTGVYDETVIITGEGLTAGEEVEVGWDSVKAWDGEKGILNSTEADSSGSFEIWFDVPEALYGEHYIWLITEFDEKWGGATEPLSDFWVDPMIEFSKDSGLPGDEITVNGYGFDEEEEIVYMVIYGYVDTNLTLSPSTPETNEVGSWEADWEVPEEWADDTELGPSDYGVYTIEAFSEYPLSDTETFTIGAALDLSVEEGPVGTVVEVSGRGFTEDATIEQGDVTLDGMECQVITDDTVNSRGQFNIEIVIPSVVDDPDDIDDFDLVITETGGVGLSGSASFELTGVAEIEVDPEFGVQGSSISISGWNFTQISGEDVNLYLTGGGLSADVYITDFETNRDGEFEGTFTVPAYSSELYTLMAEWEEENIYAEISFRIGMMIVIPSPNSGPCGTLVTLTGTGFTELGEWNATLGDILVFEGEVDDESNLEGETSGTSPQFYVPTLDPGTYTLAVLDIDTDITVNAEFTVTDKTAITTDPVVAPNGFNVTINGMYWAEAEDEDEGWDIEFLLYNVTEDGEVDEEWDDLELDPMDVETDEDGEFEVVWTVPSSDDISIGEYHLNATDEENNLYAHMMFSIVPKTVNIEPRKDAFANGETVAFNILVSFPFKDSYIEIYDPDGELYWQTDDFVEDAWIKVGTVNVVPYYQQVAGGNPMTLMDAPLGTWSWTWVDAYPEDEDEDEIDSGVFTVTEAPEDILATQIAELGLNLDGLMQDFVGLGEDLTGLQGDVSSLSGDLATLAGSVSSLASDVSSLSGEVANAIQAANTASGKVDDLAETVADIAEVASNAATAAQNAAQAATAAQTAAEQTGQQTSGLTTLVYGAIGAALVAALAAIVSLMQISRRIAG
jgi:uncharacterized protein YoxC